MFDVRHVPAPAADQFENAAIIVRTVHQFDLSAARVFAALDSDRAWRWLGPTCGVDYTLPADDGAERGRGMVRYMGTVRPPLRWVWRQEEKFTEYQPDRRLSYTATRTTWPLLDLWVEDYRIEPTSATACTLTWTVGITPRLLCRLPLRWTQPLLRLIFTAGIRPGLRRHAHRVPTP